MEHFVSRRLANAVRALSMDAVERAKSGHVGLPLGMADVATVLFTEFLKFDPTNADWPDRDRFVLSAGHGSMLQYAIMYLLGYSSVSIEDLKSFRQLGSAAPGHPENFVTAGVEATTGPLGQGLATAVGMAIAERHLNARFGDDLVDHRTYVIAGDGCLMEGVSQEAITLAGHLELNKLIVLFDDNQVTIDGAISVADRTDQRLRFESAGWATYAVDGHDPDAVADALYTAQNSDCPTMIACKTTIGYGAPTLAGTGKAHGGPYGEDEIDGIRVALDWPHEPFVVPDDILAAWREKGSRNSEAVRIWRKRYNAAPERESFSAAMNDTPPDSLERAVEEYKSTTVANPKAAATRACSGAALEVLTAHWPELVGGSADLTGSNNTRTSHTVAMTPQKWSGRYLHYGVREHGMAAAMNGMALHGGIVPYAGTFLVFSDYSRAAIRLGALMGSRVVHVMTHDSIGLGEDGPTHQPVEHLASLRAMPGLNVFRPCDAIEAVECWQAALSAKNTPSVMALSRQKCVPARLEHVPENLSANGAYLLRPAKTEARAIIIATGTEVEIALAAQAELSSEGLGVNVVSMPCFELFAHQDEAYQQDVLGGSLPKVAIEAGVRFGWDQWIGPEGAFVGMASFGASAPAATLYEHFGITAQAVVDAVKARLT